MVKSNHAYGYNISLTPSFSIMQYGWKTEAFTLYLTEAAENMEKNGMMQELKCKSKMFDDFIAAAEYLIAQKYTSDFLPFVGVKWRFTRSYYDSVQN
jgi:hypothetical protein